MAFEYSRTNLPKKLFINNEYVEAKGTEKLSVFNPKDGSLVADDVAVAGEADVEAAVLGAEKAFPIWKKTPPPQRRDMLLKLASLIEQHTEALSGLSRITHGGPVSTMGQFEVLVALEVFSLFLNLSCGRIYSPQIYCQV
jgi:aldehyde dehydrogenase (NAD+)